MYLGEYRVDDYVVLAVQLHRFSSGAEYAATGTPTYTIYENNSTNGPDGNPAAAANLGNLATETGLWTARVQLTAAAGYEAGKDYIARIEATVDGVTAAEVQTWRVIANPKVDLDTIKTQSITCGAGVTILANVGFAGAPGTNNGALTTDGTSVNQTVMVSDKTGFSLSAAGIDSIADEEYDNDGNAISLRGAIKLILAVLTGKSTGGGTATIRFRDIADTKNRISATVDANGNRTAIGTRDAT